MNIQPKTWICTECNKSNMTGPKTITIVDDILYMEAFCRSCFSTYKIIGMCS
jgi:heterodisulfide reductase subunit C